ncbi:zincin-like metallopeptidase domain-containing protein (plasmid) [Methylocaldum gracile subsp. desertum]|uniref:zincin-like metallopeptidase domain-containing protein n=1 Tax=Methylocaldum sp. GT1BW TaxID=3438964 RepID=UPI003DA1B716
MADEKSRDYRQELTDLIIRKLEEGAAPWQKPRKPGESGLFPHNPTTDKPYRGANALHLTLVAEIRNYNDPRWMTYKQAAEQGYQVRKGEKGTVVEYWKFHEERPVLDDQGQPVVDEETGKPKTVTYALDKPRVFRAVVFNAKQMDNVPEWKNEPKQFDWDPSERAEQIIRESGARIFHDQGDRAFYSPYKDEIHLPGRDQFASAEAYYGTALHELGHWTGHSSRLNRDLAHPFGSEGYAKEELRAELASYFMSHRLGIAHDTDRHAAYVKSWIKALREDKNEIFRASRDAERITEFLLSPELAKNVDLARAQSQTLTVADLTAEQYRAMNAADEIFQRELVSVYGEDKASDARYQAMHEDPAVEKARKDYHAAAEVWRNAVAQARETLGAPQKDIKMDAGEATRPTVAGELRHNDMPAMGDSGYRTFHREMVNERQESGEHHALEAQIKQLLGNDARFSALAMDDASSIQGKVIAESKYAFALQIGEKEAVSLHKIDFRRLPEIGQEVVIGAMDRDNPANGRFIQLVQPERQAERTPGEKTYLDVPYKEKNQAKTLGARWDQEAKQWYAPAGVNLEPFAKWMPSPAPAQEQEFNARYVIRDVEYSRDDVRSGGSVQVPHAIGLYENMPDGTQRAIEDFRLDARKEVEAAVRQLNNSEIDIQDALKRLDQHSITDAEYDRIVESLPRDYAKDAQGLLQDLEAVKDFSAAHDLGNKVFELSEVLKQDGQPELAARLFNSLDAPTQAVYIRKGEQERTERLKDWMANNELGAALRDVSNLGEKYAKDAGDIQKELASVKDFDAAHTLERKVLELSEALKQEGHQELGTRLFNNLNGPNQAVQIQQGDKDDSRKRAIDELKAALRDVGKFGIKPDEPVVEKSMTEKEPRRDDRADNRVIWKRAEEVEPGDAIVSTVPGHAAFVDRVDKVSLVDDNRVKVEVNNFTATQFYGRDEQVQVSPALSRQVENRQEQAVSEKRENTGRQYLDVPFKEKDEAKMAGARWDKEAKTWYAPEGANLEKLAKWLPKKQDLTRDVDPMTAFTEAARAAGLVIEGQPVVGKLTRVPVVDGRRGNRDGAYTLHLDGRPSGYIQNFRTDHAERWTHQGRRLSPEENQRLAEHAREVKAQRAEELKQQHTRLADWAEKKWSGLSLSPPDGQENGYLMRKHVKAFGVRFDGDNVVVPLRDIDGKIWSMQTIEPGEEGKKHLTKNARKEGTMHVIGDLEPGKDILVAEGYATAASLHMATGKTVIMAVDSGNLDAVVGQVKERYPTSPIYIMGDDDRFNPTKNAGAKKAMEAAGKHQVGWALPKFQVDGKLVDFNDLHVREGLDAVRHQVEETIEKTLMDAKLLAKDKIQRELVNGGVTDIVEKTIGDNTRHSGPFVYVGAYHAAQSVGRNEVVFHQIAKMDQKPETGQDVTVQYQNGRAEIRARYQDRQRQTGRSPEIAA